MISSPLRLLSGLTAVALVAAAPHVTEPAPQLVWKYNTGG